MTGWSDGASWRLWRLQSAVAEAQGALELGLYNRARRALARAIALGWRTSLAYADLARACAGEGRWSEAMRAVEEGWRYARSSGDAFDLLRVSGLIAFRRGDFLRAAHAWQQALVLQPDWLEGWYRLGVACAAAGAYREAEALFRALGSPEDGRPYAWAAACAYLGRMPLAARRDLHLAVRGGVSRPQDARGLGAMALALGQRSLALALADVCETDARYVAVALEIRALIEWMEGDPASAACLAKKAVTLAAKNEAASYLAIEAEAYANLEADGHGGPASSTMDAKIRETN
ncbi:tetratricopeptide repeat protein [Alicyclobacillus fructus]|uniref:tetratricopeptide repeat protein n=1 Tax=Alicyclobacillus fructus TaxID=2816082 RepID=UPI001A8D46E2|nr:tetratricopeptide repeat protein [Alicyclobacillus fructus]